MQESQVSTKMSEINDALTILENDVGALLSKLSQYAINEEEVPPISKVSAEDPCSDFLLKLRIVLSRINAIAIKINNGSRTLEL